MYAVCYYKTPELYLLCACVCECLCNYYLEWNLSFIVECNSIIFPFVHLWKSGVVFFLTIVNQSAFVYVRHSKISFLNQDTGDSKNFIYGQPRAVSCQDSYWQGNG